MSLQAFSEPLSRITSIWFKWVGINKDREGRFHFKRTRPPPWVSPLTTNFPSKHNLHLILSNNASFGQVSDKNTIMGFFSSKNVMSSWTICMGSQAHNNPKLDNSLFSAELVTGLHQCSFYILAIILHFPSLAIPFFYQIVDCWFFVFKEPLLLTHNSLLLLSFFFFFSWVGYHANSIWIILVPQFFLNLFTWRVVSDGIKMVCWLLPHQ